LVLVDSPFDDSVDAVRDALGECLSRVGTAPDGPHVVLTVAEGIPVQFLVVDDLFYLVRCGRIGQ